MSMENTEKISSAEKRKSIPVAKILAYVVQIVYTVFLFLPFLIILCTAFKTDAEIVEMGKTNGYTLFPKTWSLEGFQMAMSTSSEYNAINGVPSLIIGFFNSLWQTLIPFGRRASRFGVCGRSCIRSIVFRDVRRCS